MEFLGEKWRINSYIHLEVKRNENSSSSSRGINNEEIIINYSTNSKLDCYPFYWPGGQTYCCYNRVVLHCIDYGCCDPTHPVWCKLNCNCCSENASICFAGKPDLCYRVYNITFFSFDSIEIMNSIFCIIRFNSFLIIWFDFNILYILIWLQGSGNATLAIQSICSVGELGLSIYIQLDIHPT